MILGTVILDGKRIAAEIKKEVAEEVKELKKQGIRPGLATVLVGDDPASHIYVRNKVKDCEEVGIFSEKSFFRRILRRMRFCR